MPNDFKSAVSPSGAEASPRPLAVDLWFWPTEARPDQYDLWRGHLDAAEHARLARFKFARDQIRFTVCRSRMRRILGWYTRTRPQAVRFTTTGRNKPVLAADVEGDAPDGRRIHFNLSHTDGLACLAVTRGHAVGIDLEKRREVKDDFIAYALNPAEHAGVEALATADRQAAFFRVWTAKEAYLKALGTGLWQSLKSFDVEMPAAVAPGTFEPGRLLRIDDAAERARHWQIYTFQATEHHTGALALSTAPETQVEIRSRWIGRR
ncbi:MAG: 4'-phosphopantetheinyl transferase superfamily protein [Alphaproteobacteria bacterium]|nr:4'-phosphopantetheinyl transferase superfamily protein [Alphaproteobacteria bacterium]